MGRRATLGGRLRPMGCEGNEPWARNVQLKAAKPDSAEQTVLAEGFALRTSLLNLHFAVSQGQTLTGEDMRQLIDRADQNKLSKAQERLAEATTGGMP